MKRWLDQFWHQYGLGHLICRNFEEVLGQGPTYEVCTCGKEWK
jgi:hypothetical protein